MAGIVDVPWWAGVFRWVTLARAAVRVFALYGGISAAYADPTVSLRVVGRSSDERTCVVGWRDRAFGDGERTADFRCSAKAATYHPGGAASTRSTKPARAHAGRACQAPSAPRRPSPASPWASTGTSRGDRGPGGRDAGGRAIGGRITGGWVAGGRATGGWVTGG